MISSNKEVNYLIHLLSCALNEKEPEAPREDVDFSALLALAEKHQIYNMIFPLIENSSFVPEKEKTKWNNYNLTEITRIITVANERAKLLKELAENGIRFMLLKGLILKNYYPIDSMRQMSDNDILIDSPNSDLIFDIMKKNQYRISSISENSDDFIKPPFCFFEFHRTLFFEDCEFNPNFSFVWKNAERDEKNPFEYHMNLNDIYLYTVCHMYKHFSMAGCGIRFLADIYVFLKKEYEKLDWEYINKFLDKCGILDYEKRSRNLAMKLFAEAELSDDELEFLEIYINFGIYGNGTVRVSRAVDNIAKKENISQDRARRKYLFSRFFPSKKKLVEDNRILQKKPFLIPAFYVYRLFRGLLNFKKSKSEFDSLMNTKKK